MCADCPFGTVVFSDNDLTIKQISPLVIRGIAYALISYEKLCSEPPELHQDAFFIYKKRSSARSYTLSVQIWLTLTLVFDLKV